MPVGCHGGYHSNCLYVCFLHRGVARCCQEYTGYKEKDDAFIVCSSKLHQRVEKNFVFSLIKNSDATLLLIAILESSYK